MADLKITNNRKVEGPRFDVGDLRKLIDGVDDSCEVTIHTSQGDRPYDSETHSITILDVQPQRQTHIGGRPIETL